MYFGISQKQMMYKSVGLTFFVEIINLTDYQNVFYVYSRTGKPFDPGFSGVGTSVDANHNPSHVGQGRTFKAGINFAF